MVNNGASGACHACKEKRKKCDEARPACIRCSRARRKCPGYESSKDRKFINYVGEAEFDLFHQPPVGLLHQTADATHPATGDWPQIEHEARLVFFEDYCIVSSNPELSRGYLHGLQTTIDRAGPASEVAQACTVISLANLGKKLGKLEYLERAASLYAALLQSFRLSISNEAKFTTVESLMTATLLGLFEIITSSSASPSAHVGHARGVSAILVSKFSPFDLMCGGRLFKVPNPIQLEDLAAEGFILPPLQWQCSPAIIDKVSEKLSILSTPSSVPSSAALDFHLSKVHPLSQKAKSLLQSEASLDELHYLKVEAEQLKEALGSWPDSLASEWMPQIVGLIKSNDSETIPDVGYWPGAVASYHDPYIASVWNCYRKGCLLVLNVIINCHDRINHQFGGLKKDTSTRKEFKEHMEGIISSIPYVLTANVHTFVEASSTGSPPLVLGRPVSGLLSMYPFLVLLTLPTLGMRLKLYLKDCLEWIGSRMGIGQATVLSEFTTLDCQYAMEAHVIIWTGMLL